MTRHPALLAEICWWLICRAPMKHVRRLSVRRYRSRSRFDVICVNYSNLSSREQHLHWATQTATEMFCRQSWMPPAFAQHRGSPSAASIRERVSPSISVISPILSPEESPRCCSISTRTATTRTAPIGVATFPAQLHFGKRFCRDILRVEIRHLYGLPVCNCASRQLVSPPNRHTGQWR